MLDLRCRICGSLLQKGNLPKVEIALLRCAACRIRFNMAMFEAASEPVDGFSEEFFDSVGGHPCMFETEVRRILQYRGEASLRGLTVVDVGCGSGLFLDFAREQGAATLGVEANHSLRELVNRKGHRCYATLEEAFSDRVKADVVYCSHTLEHFLDPRKGVLQMRQLLRTHGTLSVTVPCLNPATYILERILWALRMRYGWGLFFPEHMSYFSRSALSRFIRSQGFEGFRWFPGVLGENLLRKFVRSDRLVRNLYRFGLEPALRVASWFGLTPNIALLARLPADDITQPEIAAEMQRGRLGA